MKQAKNRLVGILYGLWCITGWEFITHLLAVGATTNGNNLAIIMSYIALCVGQGKGYPIES